MTLDYHLRLLSARINSRVILLFDRISRFEFHRFERLRFSDTSLRTFHNVTSCLLIHCDLAVPVIRDSGCNSSNFI